jgi:hypothetical protein
MAHKPGRPGGGSTVRDFIADWKKWSAAERALAVAITLLIVAALAIGDVGV